jgi:hypothetical protein
MRSRSGRYANCGQAAAWFENERHVLFAAIYQASKQAMPRMLGGCPGPLARSSEVRRTGRSSWRLRNPLNAIRWYLTLLGEHEQAADCNKRALALRCETSTEFTVGGWSPQDPTGSPNIYRRTAYAPG